MIITIFVIFQYRMLQFRHFGTPSAQFTDPPAVKSSLQDLGLYKDQLNKTTEDKIRRTRVVSVYPSPACFGSTAGLHQRVIQGEGLEM